MSSLPTQELLCRAMESGYDGKKGRARSGPRRRGARTCAMRVAMVVVSAVSSASVGAAMLVSVPLASYTPSEPNDCTAVIMPVLPSRMPSARAFARYQPSIARGHRVRREREVVVPRERRAQ